MKNIIRAILGLSIYPQTAGVSGIDIIETRVDKPILFGGLSERSNVQIIQTKTAQSDLFGRLNGCSKKEADEIFRYLKEEYAIEPAFAELNEPAVVRLKTACQDNRVLRQLKALSRFASRQSNNPQIGKRKFLLKQKKF